MSRFRECPRCHNFEAGYTIYRCKSCGKHWCYKSGFFSKDGCGAGLSKCPSCGSEKKVGFFSESFVQAGVIE